jgi:hypothetical protein
MNSSAEEVLGSIINPLHNHNIQGGHLFYIGTGIGLSAGLLTSLIIAHYKYIQFKASDAPNRVHNDKDDDAAIAVIIDYFDTKQYL